MLAGKRATIEKLEEKIVGTTKVLLNGDPSVCRERECNFGSFIADAFVYARVIENYGGVYWTDAAIGIMNAGGNWLKYLNIQETFDRSPLGIRSSIDPGSDGSISEMDVMKALPFGNRVVVSRITGKDLLKALEYSATLRHTKKDGGFLQVSGIRMVINYNQPKGRRITSINVLCSHCRIPEYLPLIKDRHYSVIVPNYLFNGGDGHKYFKDPTEPSFEELELIDREILNKYYMEHKVVYPMLEGRITIINKKRRTSAASTQTQCLLIPIVLITKYSIFFYW